MTDVCNKKSNVLNGKHCDELKLSENGNTSPCEEEFVTKEVRAWIEKFVEGMKIKDYSMKISAGSIRGDNYLGIIAKVQVKGKYDSGKSVTLNLICKSAPNSGSLRAVAPIREAYQREIYIYSDVLVEFDKFQQERGVLDPFKSYAKFYGSTMGEQNEALVMEDMKELGFKLQDRFKPLDYDHVLLVMKEYGKFHALSFALRDQKPEVFKKLADNNHDVFFALNCNPEFFKVLESQAERAAKSLNPVIHKFAYDRYKKFASNISKLVRESVHYDSAGQHSVIGHGDCWVNNMLFKYGDSKNKGRPTELCLLDWQLARVGSPALDLSYFIFTCTDRNLREQRYEEIIDEYYDSFSSFVRQLGSDPVKLFPRDVLNDHLKRFSLYGLCMSIMVLFMMTSEVDEIPDFHSAKDMQTMQEKMQFESKNIEKYYERIRDIILDFIKFKYNF